MTWEVLGTGDLLEEDGGEWSGGQWALSARLRGDGADTRLRLTMETGTDVVGEG